MKEKKKILIADDDPDIAKILRIQLEQAGFEVLTTTEGVRTIELAHKQKPDLIILDIQMPVGTGRSVLQAFQSKPETKGIPVIILTGLEDPHLKERLLAEGAKDFFKKPYDLKTLLEKINRHLPQ